MENFAIAFYRRTRKNSRCLLTQNMRFIPLRSVKAIALNLKINLFKFKLNFSRELHFVQNGNIPMLRILGKQRVY